MSDKVKVLKDLWKDPVGAAVIAGIILAILAWAWEKGTSHPQFFLNTFPVPLWLLIAFAVLFIGSAWKSFAGKRALDGAYNFVPDVSCIDVQVTMAAQGQNLTFPLKCTAYFRNNSKGCVSVHFAKYEQGKIPIKAFRQNVIQVEVSGEGWVPVEHGTDQIAILPNQNFKLWVPIDEAKYSRDEVQGSKGQIGTLVLNVNEKEICIRI